jgi:cation:H+ antiporter
MPIWIVFLLSGAIVAAAGVRLARDGDDIAHATGLGGLWVGAILVAGATSLPELSTDISAVRQGNTGLAIGDLFGSSMANMAILAVADLAVRSKRILTRVAINQTLVATLAVCLTAIAVIGVASGTNVSVLGLGWPAATIGVAYLAGMRLLHSNRPEPPFRTEEQVGGAKRKAAPLRVAVTGFTVSAVVILLVAPILAHSAAELADQMGLSRGFVGLLLLAITTSLPEVAVSVESIRVGSYDLAVGNLLGSNCFNMFVLVILDVADGPGSVLAHADPALMIGGLFGILLTALAVLDILNKSERRIWAMEPGPGFMLIAYIAGIYLAFRSGR